MAGHTLELARGTSQRMSVEPGTTLLVRCGAVRLRLPPQWLAETWIQAELRLYAEEHHVVTSGGRVEVTALDGAEVLLVPGGLSLLEKSAAAIRRVHHALCAPLRSMR